MAENVGELLGSHASALDGAITSLVRTAIEADGYSKDLSIERTRKILKFPPTTISQHILYTVPGDDGKPQSQIVKFDIIVPSFIFIKNTPLIFKKYIIKSSFEAAITKKTGVKSETEVGAHGSVGMFGIPSIGFDISEKLTVNHDSEEKQSNSMDVEIELGQGDESFGYTEIVKAFVRCVNKVVDAVMQKGFENPAPLSDEEAKQLSEEANVPIVEASGAVDGKEAEPQAEGAGGQGGQQQPAQG